MIKFDPNKAQDMNQVFLGIDPGETTGWALMHPLAVPAALGPLGRWLGPVQGVEPFIDFLEALSVKPTAIIYERYVIRQLTRNQNHGELPTVQVIGALKSYAHRNKIKIVGQLPDIKPSGYAWGPHYKTEGAKVNSHERDAQAHIIYYQVMNGLYGVRRN